MNLPALLILLTIALPWAGALVTALLGDKRPRALATVAIIAALAATLSALCLWPLASSQPAIQIQLGPFFGTYSFTADGLAILLACIATGIGSLTLVFSIDYMVGEEQLGRYYALVLLFIGAMAGLVLTGSLFLLFLFWEVTALCSYALISFHNDDPKAVAGGIKALIITQVGGVGLLVGALLAYAYLGTFEMSVLLSGASTLPATVLALVAFSFLIAAAAKSAQVPFHTWLPGAMEAPTPISALIHAATMVNAGIYLLARFYPAFANVPGWSLTVITVGVLSLTLGALMALVSTDLKQLLAYSTVSQLGYMVYGVGSGAILASQFHLLSHAIFKALLFLAAGAVIHNLGTRELARMGGLGARMPVVRNAFIIGALGLAGIPLANGFLSKELLLEGASAGSPLWAYLLALLGTALTAFYITRAVDLVFFGLPRTPQPVHHTPSAMQWVLALLAVGTFTSWLLLQPVAQLFSQTLPFHSLEPLSLATAFTEIVTQPATYLVLSLTALGFGVWWWRSRLPSVSGLVTALRNATNTGHGFDWLNSQVSAGVQMAGSYLARTQTGLLNWNLVGMVVGLLILLSLVALGVLK